MAYLIDTNVFIEAKDHHYGFEFCPAFWDWIVASHAAGTTYSVERVWDELEVREDPLTEWARGLGSGFFLKPDPAALSALQRVSSWVEQPAHSSAAIATFLQAADFYVIAQALADGHVVVTHEVIRKKKNKIQIPAVCIGLGVKCWSPFDMLKKERARFVLGTPP